MVITARQGELDFEGLERLTEEVADLSLGVSKVTVQMLGPEE